MEEMKTEGYWGVTPQIKSVSFPKRGKFQVDLEDGRSIVMPISAFPSLKKVPVKERGDLKNVCACGQALSGAHLFHVLI